MKRRWRISGAQLIFVLLTVSQSCIAGTVHARSLADKLHQFLDRNSFPTSGEFIEVITPIVERLALRGVDFPVTATAPGITYRFNIELGVPERSESLGSVFVERADTVGRSRLDLSVSYMRADLTDLDGGDLADRIVLGGKRAVNSFNIAQAKRTSDLSGAGTVGSPHRIRSF